MVEEGRNFLKEFYEESIQENLGWLRLLGEENKVFQRIRESYQEDWKIVELCREALFDNAKFANFLREEIEGERAKIRGLSRICGRGSNRFISRDGRFPKREA